MSSTALERMSTILVCLMEGPQSVNQIQKTLTSTSKGVMLNFLKFFHHYGVVYLSRIDSAFGEEDKSVQLFCLQKIPFEKEDFLQNSFSSSLPGTDGRYSAARVFFKVLVLLMSGEGQTIQEICAHTGSKGVTIGSYLNAMHAKKIVYFEDMDSYKITNMENPRKCIMRKWRLQTTLGTCEDIVLRKPRVNKKPAGKADKSTKCVKRTLSAQPIVRCGWIPKGF